jgi:hypothetical protein
MATPVPTAHDPMREAAEVAGSEYWVKILEPSPPAVAEPPFFADDPAGPGPSDAGRLILAPHPGGDRSWDDLAAARPELVDFVSNRWLGARRALPEVPDRYQESLFDFHRVAYAVVAEARRQANTKFGLRFTQGGFGTPFFGDDVQVRVEGDQLLVQERDRVRFTQLTTLREAAAFVGAEPGSAAAEHDSPGLDDLDRRLATRAEVGDFLGDWFGFATALLEELRATTGATADRVQLWPGHFDAAIAIGDDSAGALATYGFSPGDHDHPEPYVYVAASGDVDRSLDYWNEPGFAGASLPYAELLAAPDDYERAGRFLRTGLDLLNR